MGPRHIVRRLQEIRARKNLGRNRAIRLACGIVLVLLISFFFPHPESFESNYGVGTVWADNDLVAPFSFAIGKDLREYEKECQNAARSVAPVYLRHEEGVRNLEDSLRLVTLVLRKEADMRAGRKGALPPDDSLLSRIPAALSLDLPAAEWKVFEHWSAIRSRKIPDPERQFVQTLSDVLTRIYATGIIDLPRGMLVHSDVALRIGSLETVIPATKVYTLDEALAAITNDLAAAFGDEPETALALRISRALLKPNCLFDREATDAEVSAAVENVPRTLGYVQEGERIIGKYDRVTELSKLKLDSFRRAKADLGTAYGGLRHVIGIVFHIATIVGLYAIYLFLFRKKIFYDNGKLILIGLLVLLESAFAYLSLVVDSRQPIQYLIFVPVASMLLTIIFDSRVGFYGTVTVAFLVAGIRGDDYMIALTSLIAGSLGAYTVRDIRHRTQIFRSMIYIFIGYGVSILALSLERAESASTLLAALGYALVNAVVSPVLTYGLLIFLERAFRVTTDLTLMELSDFSHPLLQELSEKAPGTFHHSVTMGNLAETAAEAIGANSILARVGGYYHDIGKILKPEYFVENQTGTQNRHSRLKPRMSALIIASHVKEGVELGREYGLPESILDFITQHHGTTRMSYFYDKALRQAVKRPTKEAIQEEDFQYPGPKPQSKETAIVMLADSVEAATRSMTEMTPQSLEHTIDNMVKHRFLEGQLDACSLTLHDLTLIREAFLKILIGTHHQRLTYPAPPAETVPRPPANIPAAVPVQQPAPAAVPENAPAAVPAGTPAGPPPPAAGGSVPESPPPQQ